MSPRTGSRLSVSPVFRRRAGRRAHADDLVPEAAGQPGPLAPAAPLFSGIRGRLQHLLARLARDSGRVDRAWRRLLQRLAPDHAGYATLAALDVGACYRPLSKPGRAGQACGDEAYRVAVERAAAALLRAGVPEDHAVAAVAFYLEACLGLVPRPADVRALVRLTAVTQQLLVTGYAEERLAGLRQLDDRERQKLAGDLHDEVGADLVVLKLYVEMIALELAKGSAVPVGPKLREALRLIAHAIESVRRLTLDLGPAFLESLGFLPALRSLARQFSVRTGIKVALDESDAPAALPASHQTVLYRVLRGALSNVAKHAKARHVTVTLGGRSGDVVSMIVEDDGKGFDSHAECPDSSFGLSAMRERIRGLHGRLTLESRRARRPGEKSGTRIEVRIPPRARVAS